MNHRRLIRASIAASLFLASPAALAGNVLDVPGPLNLTIQEAIDIAESLGVEIIQVAPGVYNESIDMGGVAVELRGDPADPTQTVIDATGFDDSVIRCISGETRSTIVDGFTLRGGLANDRGGGIYCNISSPLFRNLVVEDNEATGFGGGLYVNDAQPRFIDCTFTQNMAPQGGGAYVNVGEAGFSTFVRCNFHDNSAGSAGGVFIGNSGDAAFEDCRFEGNTASTLGGGMRHLSATTRLSRCWFSENDAGDGGGIYAQTGVLTIDDSVMAGNVATQRGGGMRSLGTVRVKHSTIAYNEAPIGSGFDITAGSLTLVNANLWGNAGGAPINGPLSATFSNLQEVDPLFVDAPGTDGIPGTADDDLRLSADSPVIDAGDSSAVEGQFPVDFDGNPRGRDAATPDTGFAVLGITVDMGAFEYQPGPAPDPCPADVNDNQAVDFGDILEILANWGPCLQ